MAQQGATIGLTLVGKLVGSYFGGPIGGMIGSLAGGLIGSLLFSRSNRPLIPDVVMMGSSFGNPLPIIYGTVRLGGTVLWMSEVTTKGHGLGKGGGTMLGGSGATSYWQNASVGFCEGPARLVKIWLDGKLFLDNTTTAGELTNFRFALREYGGGEDQLPDFLYTQWVNQFVLPPDAVPAYRGVAHMVFDKIDLAHFGNRFPQVSAVWSTDVVDTTIFRKLNRWTADVSTNHDVHSFGIGNGTAVDWARNLAYQLSSDGTIRAYDLASQQCVMAKNLQQLSKFGLVPNILLVSLDGLCCGYGTKLYLFGRNQHFAYVWIIDPDSLSIIQETPFLPWSFADAFAEVICFTLSTPDGTTELLTGHTLFFTPTKGSAFVFNPATGLIGRMHARFEGIFASIHTVIGNQDPLSGATDIWLISGSEFDPLGQIAIDKAILTGSDPTQLAQEGYPLPITILVPADFGITDPHFLWVGGTGVPVYDPSDDSLIITNTLYGTHSGPSGNFSWKWNQSAGIVWINRAWAGPQWPLYNSILDRGMVAGDTSFPNYISVVDTATGAVSQSPRASADSGRDPAPVNGNIRYDSYSNSIVYYDSSGDMYVAYLQRTFGNEVPIAGIIQDICARVGLDPVNDIDTSLVTATTAGYAILQQKSAGQAISDLCDTYQIDMVESDYKLKFVPRGQAPVATITQADLGSPDAQDDSKYWVGKRAQELEMPLQVNVKYPDPGLDYQPGSAYAKRIALPVPTMFSKRKKTIDLPVVASSQEAQQIAEKWLYTMWAERDTYETQLSAKYLYLDPTDNVTVNLDNGDSYTTRIQSIDVGADYALKLSLASEDATTYSGSTSPGPVYGTPPQTIAQSPFGNILLFNVPLLQDSDDTGGTSSRIYFAAGAYGSTGWLGGGMYNSLDGASWSLLTSLPEQVDWGFANNALGDTPAAFATDYMNTLRVTFSPGSTVPSSCSYTELMSGANAAVLGSEIIQFQTVTDNGDGTFVLSVLARGRRGTEWATGTHHSGEHLVMLEAGRLGTYRLPLAQIGQLESWRLLPLGRFLDQVPSSSFAYLGYDLMPYAPVDFERAPSGSDLVVTWHRRTRIGGLLQDGTDAVPLGEETEAYEAYVLPNAAALTAFDPTNAGTYTRAFTGLTAATLTYTAAQMTADSFTPATATLYLVVFQISAVVGRGFRGYQALPAF